MSFFAPMPGDSNEGPSAPAQGTLPAARRWLSSRWSRLDMTAHAEDRELIRAVRHGDRGAAEHLFERLACIPAMLRIRERRLGTVLSSEEREEIVQETVAAFWKKLAHYNGHRPIEAWVWGFAVREHLKAIERRRRATLFPSEEPASTEPEPDLCASYEVVRARVADLGQPDARIVERRHFEEASFAEIGVELGMPLNTVKTRYYRALERLRVLLRPLWREVAS
jgi:RNA polymerase sigma-70 factor (ECF subfamily)